MRINAFSRFLTVGCLLGALGLAGCPLFGVPAELVGSWTGEYTEPGYTEGLRWTFSADGTFRLEVEATDDAGNFERAAIGGTFVADSASSPKRITVVVAWEEFEGERYNYAPGEQFTDYLIYEVNGDVMRLGLSTDGLPPSGFNADNVIRLELSRE